MKRVLIYLLLFLFMGCSIAGGAVLLTNSSYSDNIGGGESSPDKNDEVTQNAPDDDELWTDSGNYDTSFAGGNGTSTNPYQIATAGQLAYLSYLINGDSNSSYRSRYYEQTADIDLSAHYWDAIGYSSSRYFAGKYDGGGYIISGLYTLSSEEDNQGLFGYIRGLSVSVDIKNVVIGADSVIRGNKYVGGVVGNCDTNGQNINISNCSNYGHINGSTGSVGGILGCVAGDVDGIFRMQQCFNNGNVTAGSTAGGIVGFATISISSSGNDDFNIGKYIYNCYNTGNINNTGTGSVGGIVGTFTDGYIYNCYNKGNVIGGSKIGGIVGSISDRTNNWLLNDTYMSYIYNCYNVGRVETSEEGAVIGAVIGDLSISNLYYSYYGFDCVVTSVVGNGGSSSHCGEIAGSEEITVKNKDWYMTNWSSSYQWDFSLIWSIVEGLNDSYPVLINNQQFTKITYYSNYGTDEVVNIYKAENAIIIAGDIFTREGYIIENWNTEADGTGDVYEKGDVYTGNGDLELYAQWILPIYEITLDWGGIVGGTPSTIYQWYGDAYYHEESCINEISSLTFPTNNGFAFRGFYTGLNGTGMQVVNSSGQFLTYTTEYHSWHAYFVANNPAYYDSEGGYWYIENGKMPQSKVTGSVKTTLQSQWSSLSNGSTYVMGVQSFTSKVYNGNEYCLYNNEYYLVEPIRWRLQANSSQKTGYGTTTDTLAVMDTIVYLGRYSTTEINAGSGYSSTAVDYLYNTLNNENNRMDSTYLVNWTQSMPTFGTTSLNGTAQNVTARVFVSSIDEINTVAGSGKVKFSDLVKDYLKSTGNGMLYYTRDLGTNYNNIICLNENGDRTQRKPNLTANRLGVQFTIKVTEYACVEG